MASRYLEGGSSSGGSHGCSGGSTGSGGSSVSGPVSDGSGGVSAQVSAPLLLGGGYELGLRRESEIEEYRSQKLLKMRLVIISCSSSFKCRSDGIS